MVVIGLPLVEPIKALVGPLERPDPPPLAGPVVALVLDQFHAARRDFLDTDEILDLVAAGAATAIVVRDR